MNESIGRVITKNGKKTKLIFVIGIAGILLILLSELLPSGRSDKADSTIDVQASLDETEKYRQDIERQLTELISDIKGVGDVRVMITITGTKEYVYAEKSDLDRKTEGSGESVRSQGEIVLADGGGEKQPVLRKITAPQIGGAAVVCDGAADPQTKERIVNVISAVLGLPFNRISVEPSA